jgi:hypothetical protein
LTLAAITENERLGDILAYVKERQHQLVPPSRQDQQREVGYQTRGRKPGESTDFMNDPAVIPRCKNTLLKQQPVESPQGRIASRLKPKVDSRLPRSDLAKRYQLLRSGVVEVPCGHQSDISALQTGGHFNVAATKRIYVSNMLILVPRAFLGPFSGRLDLSVEPLQHHFEPRVFRLEFSCPKQLETPVFHLEYGKNVVIGGNDV